MQTSVRLTTAGSVIAKSLLLRFATAFLVLVTCASVTQAQKQWTGGAGVDDKWSTGGNWADSAAPASPYNNTIFFTDTDVGNNNVVDHDWDINILWYSNQVPGVGHTTDLGGSNLIVRSGLYVGSNPNQSPLTSTLILASTNTMAAIQNGTLQLGTASTPANLFVGYEYQYGGYPGGRCAPTNCRLTITGTLNCTNLNNVKIGGREYSSAATGEGTLDLSGTTISSKGKANTLSLNNLYVGYGNSYTADAGIGTLRLPSSLQSLELSGSFALGYGYNIYSTYVPALHSLGVLDFGAGSSLTNFTVLGNFRVADAYGYAVILNMPQNIALTVGKSSAPAIMHLASAQYSTGGNTNPSVFSLTVSNGTFTGYLNELIVGWGPDAYAAAGVATGLLDLAHATVQIGDEPNKVKGIGTLWIGRGPESTGTLRLPPNISEISGGELIIGKSTGRYTPGRGYLDIGSNSQLHVLTATNGFYLSTGNSSGQIGYQDGDRFVDYLPTGIVFTVGSPATNVPLHITSCSDYYAAAGYYATGIVVIANGTFCGYLSELRVGYNLTYGTDGYGLLDLSSSSVQIGDELNKVKIPKLAIAGGGIGPTGTTGGQNGTLRLPSDITQIVVGDFELGNGGKGYFCHRNDQGVLDLGGNSQLQVFSVTNSFYLGANNADYGRILGLPTNGITFSLGQPSHYIPAYLGHNHAGGYNYAYATGEGILSLTNATVSAYLTDLTLGVCENNQQWGRGYGVLDLTHSTLAAFDVSGRIRIGMASNTYSGKSYGFLQLPAGNARCGTLFVGSTNVTFSYGLTELNGTVFTVTNSLLIDATGRLTNHLAGVSGGIDFTSSDPSAFVITNGGKMHLAFDADPLDTGNWYWGLRMAGDQTAYFQALNTAGALTWTTNALAPKFVKRFGIVYDGKTDKTYVGFAQLTNPGILFQAL